jgi:nicotinamide-nucleotide amidase
MAARLVFALSEHGQTVAVAESLTGGMLCSALVDVPGASAVVRGGVVSYATDLKHRLLGVDAGLLAANGPVDPDVAAQMAHGVRERLGADWGVATTGVAGPDPQDGIPAGTVYVAVAGPLFSGGFGGGDVSIGDAVPWHSDDAAPRSALAGADGVDGSAGPVVQRIGARVLKLALSGDRTTVRIATTRAALDALLTALVEAVSAGIIAEHREPGGR